MTLALVSVPVLVQADAGLVRVHPSLGGGRGDGPRGDLRVGQAVLRGVASQRGVPRQRCGGRAVVVVVVDVADVDGVGRVEGATGAGAGHGG